MEEQKVEKASGQKNVGMAVLCYLGFLVLVPLLTEAKNDTFVKYHIKQGLLLFIFWVIASAITWLPGVGLVLWLGVVVLMIIGILNAVAGKEEPLPIIGQYANKISV